MANNKTYFGTTINPSATIVRPAKANIDGAQGIALALSKDGVAVPAKGANVIGLSLFTNDDVIKAGEDVDIQVKDIGKWIAAAAIAEGAELATDATGKAVVASAGDFIVAIALSEATAAGDVIDVQLVKAGYKPAGQ